MHNQRDWYLQQMGITRWVLRNPSALRGEVAMLLPDQVRLLLIMQAQDRLSLDEPLIADVLRALRLDSSQVMLLSEDRLAMLTASRPCAGWWLGVQPLPLPGAQLVSPELPVLHRSAPARAALWQQICEHEQDFFA